MNEQEKRQQMIAESEALLSQMTGAPVRSIGSDETSVSKEPPSEVYDLSFDSIDVGAYTEAPTPESGPYGSFEAGVPDWFNEMFPDDAPKPASHGVDDRDLIDDELSQEIDNAGPDLFDIERPSTGDAAPPIFDIKSSTGDAAPPIFDIKSSTVDAAPPIFDIERPSTGDVAPPMQPLEAINLGPSKLEMPKPEQADGNSRPQNNIDDPPTNDQPQRKFLFGLEQNATPFPQPNKEIPNALFDTTPRDTHESTDGMETSFVDLGSSLAEFLTRLTVTVATLQNRVDELSERLDTDSDDFTWSDF